MIRSCMIALVAGHKQVPGTAEYMVAVVAGHCIVARPLCSPDLNGAIAAVVSPDSEELHHRRGFPG